MLSLKRLITTIQIKVVLRVQVDLISDLQAVSIQLRSSSHKLHRIRKSNLKQKRLKTMKSMLTMSSKQQLRAATQKTNLLKRA